MTLSPGSMGKRRQASDAAPGQAGKRRQASDAALRIGGGSGGRERTRRSGQGDAAEGEAAAAPGQAGADRKAGQEKLCGAER